MEVYTYPGDRPPIKGPVVTVGTFDGLHLGHQKVIVELLSRASLQHRPAVVVTFHPHPQWVVNPSTAPFVLTTKREKLQLLEQLGVDFCLVVDFTPKFGRWGPEGFVERFLVSFLQAKEVVVGPSHAFGQGRRGRIGYLQEMGKSHGFEVKVVGRASYAGSPISSTRIRHTIAQEGDFAGALNMLGHPYSLSGLVVEGDGRGRELSYPTANLSPYFRKLLPPDGVYIVKARLKGRERVGLMNVGYRPTFGKGERRLEVYLIGEGENLYGLELELAVYRRIRGERTFPHLRDLLTQLARDEEEALVYFRESIDKKQKEVEIALGEETES
jgi:riboflavin kinase/FMN adenylyltransferase